MSNKFNKCNCYKSYSFINTSKRRKVKVQYWLYLKNIITIRMGPWPMGIYYNSIIVIDTKRYHAYLFQCNNLCEHMLSTSITYTEDQSQTDNDVE